MTIHESTDEDSIFELYYKQEGFHVLNVVSAGFVKNLSDSGNT